MRIFAYAFGIAISFAMAVAIGNAWTRDHRNGVWTVTMVLGLVVSALVLGAIVGWALDQYLAFVAASATGRM